jgi:hypothetical protein
MEEEAILLIKKLKTKSYMNNRAQIIFSSIVVTIKRFTILSFFFSFVLVSCKHQQKIAVTKVKCDLDFKNAKTLTANLKANEFKFDRLNAKLSVDAEIDSSSNSFTVSLRVKKDSVIWMSISKLGIEFARVLITRDSVELVNRIKKTFFVGDFAYLSKLLNTDLDFETLQSILVGNSVSFYDEDEKTRSAIDDCQYLLSTIKKNKLRRVMEKGKEMRDPVQSIYLMPETFKIARILFYEFNPERNLDVHFSGYEKVDSTQFFPMRIDCSIKDHKQINIGISYTKVVFNEEQTFPFKIPADYEQINIKEKR